MADASHMVSAAFEDHLSIRRPPVELHATLARSTRGLGMDASQALESCVEHAQANPPHALDLAMSAGVVVPVSPKPIVKWAGGKSRLLNQLIPLLPADIHARRYVEPFAGGAALYFALQPARAILADINASLIAAYKAVQRDPASVADELRIHEARHSTDYYYACRKAYNAGTLDEVQRAGAFIYLNKTCFNGLHRVNRRGEFNVPAGRYVRPRIVNDAALRAAHHALRNVKLRAASFESVLEYARPGDFVYFDPPYDRGSTASFTQYNAAAFGTAEQDALRSVVDELDRRGCKIVVSNSDIDSTRRRYAGLHITTVRAPRAISCNCTTRGAIAELVIRNY